MKHYIHKVRRRLRLPKAIRDRVMNDFISSIEGRREAGLTDAEIQTELGTPAQAAATLNEQMAEFAYIKSPWRWACLLPVAISAGVLLVNCLILGFLFLESASIGVIGGADGPTVMFVTSTPGSSLPVLIAAVLILALSIFGFWKLGHLHRK